MEWESRYKVPSRYAHNRQLISENFTISNIIVLPIKICSLVTGLFMYSFLHIYIKSIRQFLSFSSTFLAL